MSLVDYRRETPIIDHMRKMRAWQTGYTPAQSYAAARLYRMAILDGRTPYESAIDFEARGY